MNSCCFEKRSILGVIDVLVVDKTKKMGDLVKMKLRNYGIIREESKNLVIE
ncbi:MAG: hypothetical protein LBS15_01035 [Endomicrobium sp.]|jgi:hypothetical protein|nr:hypothetical protein [Endomicrobium sp.]